MKTKQIRFIVVLGMVCVLALAGCQKEDILLIDTKEIVLSPDIKKVSFTLTVDTRSEWRINHLQVVKPNEFKLYQNWFRVSPSGGKGDTFIIITVLLIEDVIPTEDQEGRLLIEKGKKSILIPVKFKK